MEFSVLCLFVLLRFSNTYIESKVTQLTSIIVMLRIFFGSSETYWKSKVSFIQIFSFKFMSTRSSICRTDWQKDRQLWNKSISSLPYVSAVGKLKSPEWLCSGKRFGDHDPEGTREVTTGSCRSSVVDVDGDTPRRESISTDIPICTRIRQLKGRSSKATTLIVSGSDDSTIRIWDTRNKSGILTFDNRQPTSDGCLFQRYCPEDQSARNDNEIKIWDIRKKEVIDRLRDQWTPQRTWLCPRIGRIYPVTRWAIRCKSWTTK